MPAKLTRRGLLLCCAALVMVGVDSSGAGAQEARELEPGQRVRITIERQAAHVEGYPRWQLLRGTLLRIGPDTVTLQLHPDASPLSLARPAVRKMEMSLGVPSRLESALRRGFEMAALGALEWALLDALYDDPFSESTWQAAGVGAGFGMAFGIAVGALRPLERWRRVDWR